MAHPGRTLSPWPWRALAVAGAATVASHPLLASALWLDPAGLAPHTPWTAHLVHHGPGHLALDLVGFLAVAVPLERCAPEALTRLLVGGAPVLSLLLLPTLQGGVYGGLSGLAAAAVVALAAHLLRQDTRTDRWIGAGLGALFVLKLVHEGVTGQAAFAANGGPVVHLPLAHALGAAVGLAIGRYSARGSLDRSVRRGPRRGGAQAFT